MLLVFDSNISIHAPRTGSDLFVNCSISVLSISIHAPRTGSDATVPEFDFAIAISIHAPRTGSDLICTPSQDFVHDFNPRSPHGERQRCVFCVASRGDFNPRSPHGERLPVSVYCLIGVKISIHAPRTGSDRSPKPATGSFPISIHAPRTGSDRRSGAVEQSSNISIHAPRTGSDIANISGLTIKRTFQSTLPARGATLFPKWKQLKQAFQSTLPARGATYYDSLDAAENKISIHAPRTGSDCK